MKNFAKIFFPFLYVGKCRKIWEKVKTTTASPGEDVDGTSTHPPFPGLPVALVPHGTKKLCLYDVALSSICKPMTETGFLGKIRIMMCLQFGLRRLFDWIEFCGRNQIGNTHSRIFGNVRLGVRLFPLESPNPLHEANMETTTKYCTQYSQGAVMPD